VKNLLEIAAICLVNCPTGSNEGVYATVNCLFAIYGGAGISIPTTRKAAKKETSEETRPKSANSSSSRFQAFHGILSVDRLESSNDFSTTRLVPI